MKLEIIDLNNLSVEMQKQLENFFDTKLSIFIQSSIKDKDIIIGFLNNEILKSLIILTPVNEDEDIYELFLSTNKEDRNQGNMKSALSLFLEYLPEMKNVSKINIITTSEFSKILMEYYEINQLSENRFEIINPGYLKHTDEKHM